MKSYMGCGSAGFSTCCLPLMLHTGPTTSNKKERQRGSIQQIIARDKGKK